MQLAATPAAPVAAVQMAAGGDDRIVLGRDREGLGSNQAEEEIEMAYCWRYGKWSQVRNALYSEYRTGKTRKG